MANLEVNIKRTDNKVHFVGVSGGNPNIEIPFDYAPPHGTGSGFAGCVSNTIVFILGRLGKNISSYSAKAEGIRSEHPLSLKEINFHILIESRDITNENMDVAIKQAEAVSPVWQAVKNKVNIKITYELN